jgi:hypothetical protein
MNLSTMNKVLQRPAKPAPAKPLPLEEGYMYWGKHFGGRDWEILSSRVWIEDLEGVSHPYIEFDVYEYIGKEEEVPSQCRRGRYDCYVVNRQAVLMVKRRVSPRI